MEAFLQRCFPSGRAVLKVEKLPGDGGLRRYSRIKQGTKSFILMDCGKKDPGLENFIKIQKRIAPLRLVPRLFHQDTKEGFLLLEDLGDNSLESLFFKTPANAVLDFYQKALLQLIKLQEGIRTHKNEPQFDRDFFLKEIETAHYWLRALARPGLKPPPSHPPKSLLRDMKRLLSFFPPENRVFCHRDYHSRNLMLKKGRVFLIDFQDAGWGPWSYDLASLLYDCYVPLKTDQKRRLIRFYFESAGPFLKNKTRSPTFIELMIKRGFLQRGLKACGCFSAFKLRDGRSAWLKYIPPTLQLVEKTALELSFPGIAEYARALRSSYEYLQLIP